MRPDADSTRRWAWADAIDEDPTLSAGAKHLAAVMARRCDSRSLSLFHANATLARLMSRSEKSVQGYRQELERAGWIATETVPRRRGAGYRKVKTLVFPASVKTASVAGFQNRSGERPAIGGQKPEGCDFQDRQRLPRILTPILTTDPEGGVDMKDGKDFRFSDEEAFERISRHTSTPGMGHMLRDPDKLSRLLQIPRPLVDGVLEKLRGPMVPRGTDPATSVTADG